MQKKHHYFSLLFGGFMLLPGLAHFISPDFFNPFIPDFLPALLVNYVAGVIEIVLGLGLIIPSYRKSAALGVGLLMLIFLPLHVRDVFVANPAIGSHLAAYIRLPLQFVLIYWAYFLWKNAPNLTNTSNQH